MKNLRSVAIHDGTFHADEVCACALLLLFDLIDYDKIFRTRDVSIVESCEYVCDLGGIYDPDKKRFDHHQANYLGPLSSAGMILLYLKTANIIDSKFYDFINSSIILGVDAHDIGNVRIEKGICTFSQVISNFHPISYNSSIEEMNECFYKALDFTLAHFKRLKKRFYYVDGCKEKVKEVMENGKYSLIFDESLPWLECFFELGGISHPALFVVMPAREHWKLRGIPPSLEDRMNIRQPLPRKWAGLYGSELKDASGIDGAVFCHKGRFISIWETKEDALEALNKVLKLSGVNNGR